MPSIGYCPPFSYLLTKSLGTVSPSEEEDVSSCPPLSIKAFIKDQTEPDCRKDITMEEYEEEVEMEEQEVVLVDQSTVADIDSPCEATEMEDRQVCL